MANKATPLAKWSIIIPLSISIISILFNVFQYFDKRSIEEEKLNLSKEKNKLNDEFDQRSKKFQIQIDSLNVRTKVQEMNAKLPSFEFSYFGMSTVTFRNLSAQSDAKTKESRLLQDHPLLSSKYLKNNVDNSSPSHIMTLMIKQIGGSEANDVQIVYSSYSLSSKVGFSFQSDIVNLLRNQNPKIGQFRLGQISPTQSIVIPLFIYDENPRGAFDLFSIRGNVYVPKFIEFTDMDGNRQRLEIRKMLENPFSITVDIDERG